ncbi:protein UXT-like isoform X2 [Rhagoletis pomonella]|uniref:protein UXT-like isoform X2 n=2 Tax=Rhagoletis TaxID=28609 RepID=UPI001784C2CB|nr:protein UXT-like isoform X2 [Rhagoletis pomonella]
MSLLTTQNLEIFVTDFLKEDLKQIELHINKYNEQIMEYVQLRNTLQTLHENSYGSFKTQMNIGGNIFMEAKVNNPDDLVLVDVKILTKECDVLREESVKKRSDIKLALMCIADQENLYAEQK